MNELEIEGVPLGQLHAALICMLFLIAWLVHLVCLLLFVLVCAEQRTDGQGSLRVLSCN